MVNGINQCRRCGSTKCLEHHHIIMKSRGGSDDDDNMEWLCLSCHDYEHARRKLLAHIRKEKQFNRLATFQHRLSILESYNTIEMIKSRGTYFPYWNIPSTHPLPARSRKRRKI